MKLLILKETFKVKKRKIGLKSKSIFLDFFVLFSELWMYAYSNKSYRHIKIKSKHDKTSFGPILKILWTEVQNNNNNNHRIILRL